MLTFESLLAKTEKIAVVGLGYVGLPLAIQLAKHFDVVGYDLKIERTEALRAGHDRTLEVSDEALKETAICFTNDPEALSACRLIIVAVPTPIDAYRIPDLVPLASASETVGQHMIPGSCVVFESTVYPGATEEVCVPIMERESGFRFETDFTVGYSPERINPGDKVHTIEKVVKIVAGSDAATRQLLAGVYGKVVRAGLHLASSIRVAEAAKVIENTQRDLNIALMNELSMIFDKIGIDTLEVLEAAGTKWNFLPFRPGLVGGHCIGVDPYYLTFKAESLGYHPDMILAGRRVNDGMGKFVAERTVKMMIRQGTPVRGARVALLGLTFKEDVPDLRNTKVVDIIAELEDYGVEVCVHDPLADPDEARRYYGLTLCSMSDIHGADAIIIAVTHQAYREMGLSRISQLCLGDSAPVVDLKGIFSPAEAEKLGITYWRL
ncbi:nucleotide sugar dehydrogenase [Desulfonema ishimotonii]|uniref:Nucleotide sugar dehydrogenase n=2 Tax=Desulfonema ishimotonii TaxID=45657 RepID=A0A401FWE1_9BACT|nr:nucleotide sugar dehydrogenase [Desulfonema ishimotonii]